MTAVLSYWEDYFTPDADAPLSGHSTGQIAAHLYALLDRRGGCRYVAQQPRSGVDADIFVGHFWSFLDYCRLNTFGRRIAVYPVASPLWTRELLAQRATEFGVPMPWWDLPPRAFDHRATMDAADAVLVVGNRFTLETFAPEDRAKIHLANYAPDERLDDVALLSPPPPKTVCYVATHCDLRKGFMDVLETWPAVARDMEDDAGPGAFLDVMGAIRPPWDDLLARLGGAGIRYHGFVNSKETTYRDVIRSSRFVYLPTYSEGQVGTLLEAIQLGCVPITTRASGIDDGVLDHCVIVEPRDITGQRRAILDALSWPDDVFLERRAKVMSAAREAHTWARFEASVTTMLDALTSDEGDDARVAT